MPFRRMRLNEAARLQASGAGGDNVRLIYGAGLRSRLDSIICHFALPAAAQPPTNRARIAGWIVTFQDDPGGVGIDVPLAAGAAPPTDAFARGGLQLFDLSIYYGMNFPPPQYKLPNIPLEYGQYVYIEGTRASNENNAFAASTVEWFIGLYGHDSTEPVQVR